MARVVKTGSLGVLGGDRGGVVGAKRPGTVQSGVLRF